MYTPRKEEDAGERATNITWNKGMADVKRKQGEILIAGAYLTVERRSLFIIVVAAAAAAAALEIKHGYKKVASASTSSSMFLSFQKLEGYLAQQWSPLHELGKDSVFVATSDNLGVVVGRWWHLMVDKPVLYDLGDGVIHITLGSSFFTSQGSLLSSSVYFDNH
ncbi:hypothetical protein M8C21_019441 [Ambrosia artemisiifolia]|uniref:Uncharacterized protein n=1 Tax=Ambrosia artemisiifolia TaxID=4212 RepID=A0AAD5G6F9_AMBAR|nr:hypothetical protein M8C21_019441 [Ambrosia artemisiifolia]